ncbi:MAG: motility-associated protein, partial [Verrucomicrobiia bacterium]
MIVIVGFIIIGIGVLTGFAMAAGGGHGIGEMFAKAEWGAALSLIHANEFIALGGMVIGAMMVMAPMTVLKGVISQALGTLKGAPFSKADYEELFKCLYELFQLGRRGGMIALEE